MSGVLVDREALETLHRACRTCADNIAESGTLTAPEFLDDLIEATERVCDLSALARPAQAAADAAGVLRLAADLVDAEQAWERARYGSPEARAAHGASWDAVKGMYQVGAPRLRALADALEVQG